MIISGLGTRQTVLWSRLPRNGTLAPFLRTIQQHVREQDATMGRAVEGVSGWQPDAPEVVPVR
jgi:hypothetical protein